MYYAIRETLESYETLPASPYVAVMNVAEWQAKKDTFDLGIDLEMSLSKIYGTKAEVNYDSLTGTFSIPDRDNLEGDDHTFAFALDEKGIVFIDNYGYADLVIKRIQRTKRWRSPSMERFLYDFLEQIVSRDLMLLEKYERNLDNLEDKISENEDSSYLHTVNEIRGNVRDLRIHYAQMIDFTQELEENENGVFVDENIRYFHMFKNRVERLYNIAGYLRDYTEQLGDVYHLQLEAKQNRIMTVLTVVSTIFMPLTLITGWFGMNFRYMPELESPWAYPIVIAICIVIIVGSLIYCKKKKIL